MNSTERKITKYRAILHFDTGDVIINDVAVYPDSTIGFTEDALKKVLPEHHYIDWEDSCIRYNNPRNKRQDDVNVCSILTGDDYIWIDDEKSFTLQKYINKNDKYGAEIYEGDTCAFDVSTNFKKVLVNHFIVKWEDYGNGFEGYTQFSPLEKIVVCNDMKHLVSQSYNEKKLNLITVIDKQVKQLSYMQIELSKTTIYPADYNEITSRISDLKEFMVNCDSYKKP
jgi:hypothetical protein